MGKGSAGRFLWACVLCMVVGGGGGVVAFVWGGALRLLGGGVGFYFSGVFASAGGALVSGGTGHWAIIL